MHVKGGWTFEEMDKSARWDGIRALSLIAGITWREFS